MRGQSSRVQRGIPAYEQSKLLKVHLWNRYLRAIKFLNRKLLQSLDWIDGITVSSVSQTKTYIYNQNYNPYLVKKNTT